MKKKLSWEQFIKVVKEEATKEGSAAALARKIGFHKQYMNDILHGHKPVSSKFARKLGYEKKVTEYYEKID